MAGINAGWDNTNPADADVVKASDIRSIRSNVQGPLDAEHTFTATGGANMGRHRQGSAVVYVGTASQVSTSDLSGRLMYTSDTSDLFHVGSAVTLLIGGTKVVSGVSDPGSTRHHWLEQWGEKVITSAADIAVAFPSAYSGVPYVTVSAYSSGGGAGASIIAMITQASTVQFTVRSKTTLDSFVTGHSVFWHSIGSRYIP